MPIDITSVTVLFENGIKREEYGPTRKASVSMTAAVDKGEDGVVAMHYLGTVVRAKVAEMLGLEVPAEALAQISAGAAAAPLAQATAEAPKTRTRRTAEQKAADEAAAASAKNEGASTGAASTEGSQAASGQQSAGGEWEEPKEPAIPPTSSGSPASTGDDEWSTGGAAAEPEVVIADSDLAMHCSKHAQRLGGGDKVKGVITTFKPSDWKAERFGVTDIPPAQRPAFVAALEALS